MYNATGIRMIENFPVKNNASLRQSNNVFKAVRGKFQSRIPQPVKYLQKWRGNPFSDKNWENSSCSSRYPVKVATKEALWTEEK